MLSGHLQKKNYQTYHASGDCDLLIVQKAVEPATPTNTVLIGDDTDLLILLIYLTNLESYDLFFQPEPKKTTKNPRSSSCMRSLGVILHPTCMAFVKEPLSTNS